MHVAMSFGLPARRLRRVQGTASAARRHSLARERERERKKNVHIYVYTYICIYMFTYIHIHVCVCCIHVGVSILCIVGIYVFHQALLCR